MTGIRLSLEDVLAEFGPMLTRTVASYERDPGRQQDLLQDISIALWQSLSRWQGEGALKSYVARIAHNRCVDHIGRETARVEIGLAEDVVDPQCGPIEVAHRHRARQSLLQAMHRLPLGQRQVLTLFLEGFTQAETGQALGVDENTVAQRLSRARRTLKSLMEHTDAARTGNG